MNADIVCAYFQAYVDSDRTALEAVLAPDLRFTSPLDNALDLATYLDVCWPTHAGIAGFRFVRVVEHDDTVLVTYEQSRTDSSTGRNTEVLTLRDGRIRDVEVYFGWALPHPAAPGTHRAPD
jgi:ketosteroid isomerase-like protein